VATGASPVIPPIEGVNLPGIFTLYTVDSAREVLTFLKKKKRIAVIGAGLIGLQTVGALLKSGRKAFLIEMKDQILPQTLDLKGARIIEEKLRQKGVDIYLGQKISRIYGSHRKKVIILSLGNELMTDGVILAVGIRPNVDFLQGSDIALAGGVIIDQHCRTNSNGVYAAGDVAEAPDPLREGHPTINASWPNAIKQGKVAGLNMAGKKVHLLQNVRYNAFTLFDLPCISIGLIRSEEGIQLEEIVFQEESSYRKFLFKDGFLVGAILIGDVEDAGVIANIIERFYLFPHLQEVLQSNGVISCSMTDYLCLMTNSRVMSQQPRLII
jgi:NAD(P)H-nitrite reductase large subunit